MHSPILHTGSVSYISINKNDGSSRWIAAVGMSNTEHPVSEINGMMISHKTDRTGI
jgi:hypothetical protein